MRPQDQYAQMDTNVINAIPWQTTAPSPFSQAVVLGFCQHDERSDYRGSQLHSVSVYISPTEVRPTFQNSGNLAEERFIRSPNGQLLERKDLMNKIKQAHIFYICRLQLQLNSDLTESDTWSQTAAISLTLKHTHAWMHMHTQTLIVSIFKSFSVVWIFRTCVIQGGLSWTIKAELIGLEWSWILMCDPELNSRSESCMCNCGPDEMNKWCPC